LQGGTRTRLRVKKTVSEKKNPVPNDQSVQTFAQNLRGELIQPADQQYETARKLYNGLID